MENNILDGLSMDIEQTNMDKLKVIFPECFAEGKLDIDKLLSLCGEYIDNDFEKYKFEWKGKSECLKLAQKRSTGTLRPCPEESVNFGTTQNLYIEGDNLEVLKLLQTSYYRKVKMIYIDPPYNTGNDFVYEDDFADPMARYKEVTQQTTKSNPETMGRYHTNWLNMMYPRLRLAANLLRDDGVIFISIDDNEVTNLRKVCDEVFGEENFIGMFTWQSKKGGGSDNNTVVRDQEYIICYGKSVVSGGFFNRILIEAEPLDREDEQGKYRRGRELNKWGSNSRREDRPTMFFPIPGPNGEDVYPIRNDGIEGCWRWGKENMLAAVKNGDVEFSPRNDGTYIVYEKIRTTEPRLKPYRTMLENVGSTADGSKLIKTIFDELKVFDFPKPIDLIEKVLEMGCSDNDIILDFFSGSATTAHAVMQLNAEDGGNRRFICVQLPEVCDEKSEAYKAGYKNICEIGKERIRRAGAKILEKYSPPVEGCPQGGVVENTQQSLFEPRGTENYMSLPYNPSLKERAKELRKAGNLSEVLLWQQLHNKQFKGLDFDRQKIIGNYIVDFYCASRKVVIEIDGYSHNDKVEYDKQRDAYLSGLGLTVLHIADADVKNNLSSVMNMLGGHEVFATTPTVGHPSTGGELDIGFKVFKLDTSNLKTWDSAPVAEEELQILFDRMNGMIHRVKSDRTDMDMIYEIMLKLGVPLTYSVGKIDANGKTAYTVGEDCLLLICLADDVQPEDVEAMAEYAPAKLIIARDSFKDDTAMANAHYILRDRGIELKLI